MHGPQEPGKAVTYKKLNVLGNPHELCTFLYFCFWSFCCVAAAVAAAITILLVLILLLAASALSTRVI